MTVHYKDEPLHYVTVPDEPHDLEEELIGAAGDGDNQRVNDIFLTLYKEGRTEEIEYILTRYFFTPKKIATALDRLGAKVKEMEADPVPGNA